MVPMNKINRRCCRDCRSDRNFSISTTLAAAVAPVGTREFKIYDVTVTKTSLKIESSSLSIFSIVMSICLNFES